MIDDDSALMFFGGLTLGLVIMWVIIRLGKLLRDLSKGS